MIKIWFRRVFIVSFFGLIFCFLPYHVFARENLNITPIETDDDPISNSGTFHTLSITAASAGGGVSGVSEISNAFGLAQNNFTAGDINLTQGTLQFSESDLVLPGKNGLDLVVGRIYNSRFYTSDTTVDLTQQKMWGGWSGGHGWRFSFSARAFYVQADEKKIVIDTPAGIEEFEYDQNIVDGLKSYALFKSTKPGSFQKVRILDPVVGFSGVSLVLLYTEDGRIYEFSTRFYSEKYKASGIDAGGNNVKYCVEGFYLTKIRDLYGNEIIINYDSFGEGQKTVDSGKLGYIIGKAVYDWIDNNSSDIIEKSASIFYFRPSKIIDTFERNISFFYDNSTDSNITKISHLNVNGGNNEIKYSYNNHNLAQVQVGNLPPKIYSYTYYTPNFHFYYFSAISINGRCGEAYIVLCDDNSLKDNKHAHRLDDSSAGIDKFYGYLLTQITNEIGLQTSYEYENNLHMLKIEDHKISQISGFGDGVLACLVPHPSGSYPIVKKKVIRDSQTEFVYNINYPLASWDNHPIMTKYYPVNSPAESYYFASATIDNPSQIEDETYEFSQAMPVKHVQGVLESSTEWDVTNNRQTKVTTKKNNRVLSQIEFYSYDNFSNPLRVITRKGNSDYLVQENAYYSDSSFSEKNLVHLLRSSKTTESGKANSRAYFMTYTDEGKLKEVYEGDSSSGTKQKALTYDSNGRVLTEMVFGPAGNLVANYQYAFSGSVYMLSKSINGKLMVQEFETNTGKLKKAIDANGSVVNYNYDDYGRPIAVVYPNSSQDTFSYSTDLKVTTITSAGRTVSKKMDSFGRTVELDNPSGEDDLKYVYGIGATVSKVYKNSGSGWIEKNSFTYDSYLRRITATSSDWGTVSYAYNDSNDSIVITDPKERQTQKNMDEFGRIINQTFLADNSVLNYEYDGFGQVIKVKDPRDLQYKTDFDAYGRITNTYYSAVNDVGAVKSHVNYYSNGLPSSVVENDESGNLFRGFSYAYDIENRITEIKDNEAVVEKNYYDETSRTNSLGRLSSQENLNTKVNFDYDTMGRVNKKTTLITSPNYIYSIQTQYDNNGNVNAVVFNDNKKINYSYDGNQRLSGIQYESTPISTYTYNSNGTLKSLTYGNGLVITYAYTKDVLLNKMVVQNASGNIVYQQSYSYDTVGNVTTTTHPDYLSNTAEITRAYDYNSQNALKSVGINNVPTYTHNYDKNGNFLRFETLDNKGLNSDNITVAVNNNRIAQKTYKDSRKITYAYDPVGNIVQKQYYQGGGVKNNFEYSYNYQNQISEVKKNNQVIARYYYNPQRELVYSWDYTGKEKVYYWDCAGRIIGEGLLASGSQISMQPQAHSVRYIYSGNQKIAMMRPNGQGQEQVYYFINNAQGTPVMIVNAQGKIESKINLDEWGNLGLIRGSKQEINFTGKKLDSVTGLYYFNQRWYDPEIGRFMQEDPAGQGLNPYLYCANNPMGYIDPDGRFFFVALAAFLGFTAEAGAVAAAVAAAAAVADAACWEGAKSYAINVGFQYATNGQDWGAINWNSANRSFWGGAFTRMFSTFATPNDDLFSHMLAAGVNNGMTNMAMGAVLGQGSAWDNFMEGFGVGSISGVFKWGYKKIVGYRPRMESGEGVIDKRQHGEAAREWYNVIANPVSDNSDLINDYFPGREGGPISVVLNFLPGTNSFAHLHDNWAGGGLEISVPTLAPAYFVNQLALYPEYQSYYGH